MVYKHWILVPVYLLQRIYEAQDIAFLLWSELFLGLGADWLFQTEHHILLWHTESLKSRFTKNHKVMIVSDMFRVGTKKMTKMDFHEILPLDQFKSESKEFLGYFYVQFLVFTRQLI